MRARERAELNQCNEIQWESRTDVTAAEEGKDREGGGEERKWEKTEDKKQRDSKGEGDEGSSQKKKQERMGENESREEDKKEMTESSTNKNLLSHIPLSHLTLSHEPPSIIKCVWLPGASSNVNVITTSSIIKVSTNTPISSCSKILYTGFQMCDQALKTFHIKLHHMLKCWHQSVHHLKQCVTALHKSLGCGCAIFILCCWTVCGHAVDDAYKRKFWSHLQWPNAENYFGVFLNGVGRSV